MKTAAAYIRVSTDDQVEYSPASQLEKIREYAKRNGYIRASLAQEIAPLMDSGRIVNAKLLEVTGGTEEKNYGCNIRLEIQ